MLHPERIGSILITPDFLKTVWQQTAKDLSMSGGGDLPELLVWEADAMIDRLAQVLAKLDAENSEFMAQFLYRVDVSEKVSFACFSAAHISNLWEELAIKILNREAIKCWTRAQYKP